MAALDNSIVLLSSMSPKISAKKKTPTMSKLSLRKHVRQSLDFEKLPHVNRHIQMILLDSESAETGSSGSVVTPKLKPDEVVMMPDSDDEEDAVKSDFVCPALSASRYKSVSKWVEKVNLNMERFENVAEETFFSNLSVIGGEGRASNQNGAISSTFIAGDKCRRFDQLFSNGNDENNEKKKDETRVVKKIDALKVSGRRQKVVADNSGDGHPLCNVDLKNTDTREMPKAHKNFASERLRTPESTSPSRTVVQEHEKLLDELYGEAWRINKDKVFPKTEPKKRNINPTAKQYEPRTEKPLKISTTHKNPYLDSEVAKSNNLLRALHSARARMTIESPLFGKLQELCDSDTCSEDTGEFPGRKLVFDESDSEKENLGAFTGTRSLGDLLRRKLNFEGGINKTNEVLRDKCNRKDVRSNTSDCNNISGDERAPPLAQVTKARVVGGGLKKLNFEDGVIKKKEPAPRLMLSDNGTTSDTDGSSQDERAFLITRKAKTDVIKRRLPPRKLSFLASLSSNVPVSDCDASARLFKECYKVYKVQLSQKLFKLYNEKVFDNAIPANTPVEWSEKLSRTAGTCRVRRTLRATGKVEYSIRITLSAKVLDSAERLRDTLIHEMCHAATRLVNNASENHGPHWKAWASKAMRVFPELPPINVCHDYHINTKYTYKCTDCGYCIGRHSKSLNVERMRCGHCYGKFDVFLNKTTKNGGVQSVPVTPGREVTGFALFVKQNYADMRTPERKHKDVMQLLSKKFNEMKTQ